MLLSSEVPQPAGRVGDGPVCAGFSAALAARGSAPDAAQRAAARRLERLFDELVAFKTARRTRLRKLLVHPPLPRGVWLWGGVGRGKTLLMDSFYAVLPYRRKRRVHFHALMREIHARLRAQAGSNDPLVRVAEEIARETRVLCIDEFHVTDIADAMILARLLEKLFQGGVVLCVTANQPPAGLYPNGLQRERLLPAIALLEARLDLVEIDAGIDYRLQALQEAPIYLTLPAEEATAQLGVLFEHLAQGAGHAAPLVLQGRALPVVRRAPGVVWFEFGVLCGGPRAQSDYLELAERFPALLLSGVPRLPPERANETRRLIWLVDVLYDHRVKLIIAAEATAEALCPSGPLAWEFQRTVSRLAEMRSAAYLSAAHRHTGQDSRSEPSAA